MSNNESQVIQVKRCAKCDEWRTFETFYNSQSDEDGKKTVCTVCWPKYESNKKAAKTASDTDVWRRMTNFHGYTVFSAQKQRAEVAVDGDCLTFRLIDSVGSYTATRERILEVYHETVREDELGADEMVKILGGSPGTYRYLHEMFKLSGLLLLDKRPSGKPFLVFVS